MSQKVPNFPGKISRTNPDSASGAPSPSSSSPGSQSSSPPPPIFQLQPPHPPQPPRLGKRRRPVRKTPRQLYHRLCRAALLRRNGIFVLDANINDSEKLAKLHRLVKFHQPSSTWLRRSAFRYAASYVHSNIAGFVKGFSAAADTAEKSSGTRGKVARLAQLRVFNLRNTLSVPVNEVVGILERLLVAKATKVVVPMSRNGDALFTHANVSLVGRS